MNGLFSVIYFQKQEEKLKCDSMLFGLEGSRQIISQHSLHDITHPWHKFICFFKYWLLLHIDGNMLPVIWDMFCHIKDDYLPFVILIQLPCHLFSTLLLICKFKFPVLFLPKNLVGVYIFRSLGISAN
jgi:hypothetical protein